MDIFRPHSYEEEDGMVATHDQVFEKANETFQKRQQNRSNQNPYQPLYVDITEKPTKRDAFNTDYRNEDNPGGIGMFNNNGVDGAFMQGNVLFGDNTDAAMGGKTVLQNSAAARNPTMQFYGNIPRVRADQAQNQTMGFTTNTPELQRQRDMEALQMYQTTLQRFCSSTYTQPTPSHNEFFSVPNLANIHRLLQNAISYQIQKPVRVDPDVHLQTLLIEFMVPFKSYNGPVEYLNKRFLEVTVPSYLTSLQAMDRFQREVLLDDRERTGRLEDPINTRGTRGENEQDASLFALRDPRNKDRESYLKATGLCQGRKNYSPLDNPFFRKMFQS